MPPSKRLQEVPAPPDLDRVETGAVSFGKDWPGLFIRGDEAYDLALRIRQMIGILGDHPDADVSNVLGLLNYYADMIDEWVVVR